MSTANRLTQRPNPRRMQRRRLPRAAAPSLLMACALAFAAAGCAARRVSSSTAASSTAAHPTPAAPEIRALWVDAFHAGIRSPQEAAQLVADAKSAHINMLIVQVRRRGDALYTKSVEPPLDDPDYDPQFDALAHIIEVAHRKGLEVHAWVNAMPLWRDQEPPRDLRHVFNLHGPDKSGSDHWLTLSPQGEDRFPVGYFLDPGHPAAAAHVAEVYLNIVRNYPVDGIHFDYIRYPETNDRLARGAPVGYNATALERFRRATGRSDTPPPDDEQWMAWRRQQVTNLVRRVYLEAKAVKPLIKVSAAVIAWGKPPSSEKDFLDAAPGQRIFQDWHGWLKAGILDLAIPMNYAREADPTVRGWFDGWIRWEKKHKHGRQLAVGIGAYLNANEATLAQASRARQKDGRRGADGVSFFSYASIRPALWGEPAPGANQQTAVVPAQPRTEDRLSFLTVGVPVTGDAIPAVPGAFTVPARLPPAEWIERPKRGLLAGTVRDIRGTAVDGVKVRLRRSGIFARTLPTEADGNGFFGFTNLKPGHYRVWCENGKQMPPKASTEIIVGQVAHVTLVCIASSPAGSVTRSTFLP